MDSLNAILTVLLFILKLLSAELVDGYCYRDSQCIANRTCCLGFCIQSYSCKGYCRNNWDCPNDQPVCDTRINKCVSGCFTADDCPNGYTCVSGTCEKKWRHGSSDPKKDTSDEPFSNIEESSSILGLMIAGIVALIFFAWICCQCFRFRLRRQELQLRGYRFDEPSPTSPHSHCDHNFFHDPDGSTYYDRNSAHFDSIYSRSSFRLSLDRPPRYSALFLDQGTDAARTPPPTYDEALRIVQLTTTCANSNTSPRTSVSTQAPSLQGIGTVV